MFRSCFRSVITFFCFVIVVFLVLTRLNGWHFKIQRNIDRIWKLNKFSRICVCRKQKKSCKFNDWKSSTHKKNLQMSTHTRCERMFAWQTRLSASIRIYIYWMFFHGLSFLLSHNLFISKFFFSLLIKQIINNNKMGCAREHHNYAFAHLRLGFSV